jgi:hypothetical protein
LNQWFDLRTMKKSVTPSWGTRKEIWMLKHPTSCPKHLHRASVPDDCIYWQRIQLCLGCQAPNQAVAHCPSVHTPSKIPDWPQSPPSLLTPHLCTF